MNDLFVCYGGSGSMSLIKRLRGNGRRQSPARPETYWLPHYFPQQKKSATKWDQRLDERGYANFPSQQSSDGFFRRTKFRIDPGRTIDDNLLAYVDHVRGRDRCVPMFSRAPMHGFFARNQVKGAVFVVRHPMHQYVSLTKPERHFEFVEDTGGVNTQASIQFWITEWTLYVRDALESDSAVVRYEFARSDSIKAGSAFVTKMFAKWAEGRRNRGKLDPEIESRLREETKDLYDQLYDTWDV